MRFAFITAAAALLGSTAAVAVTNPQSPVTVHLNYGTGLTPGSGAYVGFTQAAAYWSSVLTTTGAPVTVNINAAFDHLGKDILGSTQSNYTGDLIANVEQSLATRGYGARDAATVQAALGNGQYGPGTAVSVYTPGYTNAAAKTGIDNTTKIYDTDGSQNNSAVNITTANAKALGEAIDPTTVDASITFSSDFAFDFNARNGIDANKSDFLAVAIHEIGHALGFVSGVDIYDYYGTGGPCGNIDCGTGGPGKNYDANDDFFADTLDLFRYSAPGKLDWTTGTASYFSLDGGVTPYEKGLFSTGTYNGDSWQASHWKAPQVYNAQGQLVFSCKQPKLGILNPYICDGRAGIVTALDLAAQDAIGWNLNPADADPNYAKSTTQIAQGFAPGVPEPASWALFIAGFGVIGGMQRRRRSGYATA